MSFRGRRNYYQHDDRGSGFNGHRVSFKQGFSGNKNRNNNNNNNRQRMRDDKYRKYLDNDDVDMTMKINPNRGRGIRIRYNPMMGRRILPNDTTHKTKRTSWQGYPSSWYQVTLSHGKKYPRQDLMNAIQQYVRPTPFVPFNIKTEGDDMTFYVDNEDVAKAILSANFKIQMPDGWKVQIKVQPTMPFVEMDDTLKEKIRVVMSSKFDVATQSLNLSKFHANEEFVNSNLFVPLNRPNMLLAVFQIIAESVPNLRSLNLSNNKIFSKEKLVMLKRSAPDLKSLDLSKNKIRNLSVLSDLQGMKLETLVLDENPLCDDFHDQTAYVSLGAANQLLASFLKEEIGNNVPYVSKVLTIIYSFSIGIELIATEAVTGVLDRHQQVPGHVTDAWEVRKIFKCLRQLDGVDLPPPVDFGIEETQSTLPPTRNSFLCNPEGEAFTKQFLEQFFNMYDNQISRDSLSEAYAENAQFSMTVHSSNHSVNMSRYILESRNWKKLQFERRSKLLHVGKQEIVRRLNTLPKTQHDLSTFSVDLLVYMAELISLTVCGVFRETDVAENTNRSSNIKAFSRTFMLVSNGSGFNIVNDMLSITNASSAQISNSFRSPVTPIPSTSSAPSPQAAIVQPLSAAEEEELNRKRQMVTALSMKTGMNLGWSEKCLVETYWNYDNALYSFTEHNKARKIPPEAFK